MILENYAIMKNEKKEDAIIRQARFIPPYCPNPKCKNHQKGEGPFYKLNGMVETKKHPGVNQCFKCHDCKKGFSYNTFSLDYYKKVPGLNETILSQRANSTSIRSIGRYIGHSEHMVRKRIAYLARQCLIRENMMSKEFKINEDHGDILSIR